MLSASSAVGARLAVSAPLQTRSHDHRAALSPAEPAQRPHSVTARVGASAAGPLRSHMRSRGAASSTLSSFATGSGSVCTRQQRGSSLVSMVIPFQKGEAYQQPPPDLPSYLFKNRIVFLGMSLVPAVTELVMAELLYLQYEDNTKPIYMYINSTGTTKDGEKLGYETEAFAIYDTMMYVKPPIFTLCVGNAWGEAALLLAAGAKGNRSALPSSTIMMKQPIARFRGQATDINIMRKEIRNVKGELVKLYSRHTGHSEEKIEADIERPMYFSPDEAVEYGVIDKVLHPDSPEASVMDSLRKRELIKS